MALIYQNRLCIYANELISYDERRKIGSEKGFIPEGTFQSMKRRKQVVIVQRASRNRSAIIDFETMRPDIKEKYIQAYGDPRSLLNKQAQQNLLEEAVEYSNDAHEYYATTYRYDGGKKLPPQKVEEYTVNVRVLEAILTLRDQRQRWTVGGGSTRINLWERLCRLSNELRELTDPHGHKLFPHTLPANAASLKRKADAYDAARRESREAAFRTLIHKGYGNRAAAKVQDEDGEAILHKLISLHNNLNSVQVMEEYNKVADVMGLKRIASPATIDNYKRKMELTVMQTRHGEAKLRNTRLMQMHRQTPDQALTFWTLDGWTAELFYQKKTPKAKNGTRYLYTTYTNRKTVVVVLDACCRYPIGYAIGDHECVALIRQALRNAVRHTRELFGNRYKPLQLQSDNYQKGVLTPFYEALSRYYTPAAVGNAKSKIIEPYFAELNREYCQKQANWSGHNITARAENQPNLELLNEHRALIPDEQTVIGQIEAIIAQERAKKLPELMVCWERTEERRKMPFCDEEYLMLMGETTGRTNRMTGSGLYIELQGSRLNYESFDLTLREHFNEDWLVRYDPDDLSQVLISNAGRKGTKDAGKEIGTLNYLLQRSMTVPMALADQRPEHVEYRNRVRQFNRDLTQRIDEKRRDVDERVKVITQQIPAIGSHGLLDRYLLTDAKGQHKDKRSEQREEVIDADFEEIMSHVPAPQKKQVTTPSDDDDDYEFNASDFVKNDF